MERNNRRFDDMKTGTQRMYIYTNKGYNCGNIEFHKNMHTNRELTLSIRSCNSEGMSALRNLEFEIIDSLKAKGFTVD